MRRDREGQPRKPVTPEIYAIKYGTGYGGRLPAAPLAPLLRSALEHETETDLAWRAGIAPKRVADIVHGRAERVALTTADGLCVALGLTLSLVYPEAA